ncbi:hypothetical protein RSSM_04668 [Rhodopirellula sallentina SM41]|uniref:Uncharacterized protein n=1 Tax=Rhodopirellula sallentina SM41 TaxID=1263870 RepID=M5U7S4_9BACT|nr:hypothetical protein RSSM_04668 [Rhodopirellula sallentina SM41]
MRRGRLPRFRGFKERSSRTFPHKDAIRSDRSFQRQWKAPLGTDV